MDTPRAYSLQLRDEAAKQEFWACLALRDTPGIDMRRMNALLENFGSAYNAVQGFSLWRDAGIPDSCVHSFKKEEWRNSAYCEWSAVKNSPCGILLWADPEYPSGLRSIADTPPFLYFWGDISLLQNFAVAVVGMRSCSEEGLKATIHISRGLCKAGVTIVSGMAKGVDRAAHLAGLEGPSKSIGVLGAGIDVEYPRPNGDLFALMRGNGLLLSEYPPGFGVDANCFPVRNRIISGLFHAVVVVEAAVRSGSLNTSKHALEQNRELMAVPGPVTASSAKGCQELIRRGAKPVFCADDILQELLSYLSEHMRHELAERDSKRFRMKTDAEAVSRELPEVADTALPWRSYGAKHQEPPVRETERLDTVRETPVGGRNLPDLKPMYIL
jgi:DNA processing protein